MKAKKRTQRLLQEELRALRGFVEARLGEVKSELQRLVHAYSKGTPLAAPAKKAASAKKASRGKKASSNGAPQGDSVGALQAALEGHPHSRQLVAAGSQRDQLLRSLVPLYLAQGLSGVEVNSGAISGFWKAHGVSYAGPNAAKALREHTGNASKKGKGWVITSAGVSYVEAALSGSAAA